MTDLTARLEPIATLEILLGEATLAGAMELGTRRVSQIVGGSMTGDGLNGTILPGGSDWQLIRSDGVTEFAARYLVRLDTGVHLSVRNQGYRHGPAEVMAALGRGETVDPSLYYFGSTLVIEAPAGPLAWLNATQIVANGAREGGRVRKAAFALRR